MRFATAAALAAVCVLLAISVADHFPAAAPATRPHGSTRPSTTTPHAAPVQPAATSPLDETRYRVERHVLDNGLVVLLHEDHSVPAVTFWQWFKVGSRNEHPGITGISHVFEHMMFNGSQNVPPKEYDRRIESNGGASNAFTDRDVT